MLFDAHLHLGELPSEERVLPGAALSSVHDFHDPLVSQREPRVILSYGIHPLWIEREGRSLDVLTALAAQGTIAAVGECGFDFYHGRDEEKETRQREIFLAQCAVADRFRLPLVIHVRRGMKELFAHIDLLRTISAVIFHCYPGTAEEGNAFLRRGVNAFFSFGTPLLKGYRGAVTAFQRLPRERLLLETDAPFQPLSGHEKTLPSDLLLVYERAACLLGSSRENLEERLWRTATEIFPVLREMDID